KALGADLGNLANAIANPTDFVVLMRPDDGLRALTIAPGLAGATMVIAAPALAAKQIVAIDAADFVSGETDVPRFDISANATLHLEDSTPLPIASPGSPNTVAAPTQSMFQQDTVALRALWYLTWGLRRPNRIAVINGVTW